MGYQHILFEVDDVGVATVTLNRPQAMNTWTGTMAYELSEAMQRCATDDAVRVVVITGAGDKAFCAGLDLSEGNPLEAGARPPPAEDGKSTHDVTRMTYPFHVPKPVIAAINGHAIGIGITYPILADIRFVSDEAKISFMFVRRGLVPELAAHALVPKLCGFGAAADLLFSGRTVSGKDAAAMGLMNQSLPQAEVLPAALALAREIAVNAAPAAVAASKKLMWDALDIDMDAYIKREAQVFLWLGKQPDSAEGFGAFLQKRPPQWKSSAGDVPAELFV